MPDAEPRPDPHCVRLCQRIALSIAMDELAISELNARLAVLRERGDPAVPDFEHTVRHLRVGIIKQRAIIGAAGFDV